MLPPESLYEQVAFSIDPVDPGPLLTSLTFRAAVELCYRTGWRAHEQLGDAAPWQAVWPPRVYP